MWLKNDSAASSTVITYKAIYTGACSTAAIPEVATGPVIKLYPAPVSNQLTIEGLNSLEGNTSVFVYDILGNVVIHQQSASMPGALNLNTSSLNAGIYIVGIEVNGARIITRRIQKQD
jgi:hypothetical protein